MTIGAEAVIYAVSIVLGYLGVTLLVLGMIGTIIYYIEARGKGKRID